MAQRNAEKPTRVLLASGFAIVAVHVDKICGVEFLHNWAKSHSRFAVPAYRQ